MSHLKHLKLDIGWGVARSTADCQCMYSN